jgi:Membrane-bound metallopeptidase
MEVHELLSNLVDTETEKWREKLKGEIDVLEGKKLLWDNPSVEAKLIECIWLANRVLTHFVEQVLGAQRTRIFAKEYAQLDSISELQNSLDKKTRLLAQAEAKLLSVQKQCEELNAKLK